MRKHFSFALAMAVITMLCLASCENKQDETNSTSVPTTAQGAQKRLTGEEQLEKLNSLGEQILSQFKTQEQEDLVRLTDYLTAHFENTDWSVVMDSAGVGHSSYARINSMMATLRRISECAYYSPMNLMGVVATLDNWYVSDFFGEFKYREGMDQWQFTGKNDNAAIFRCANQNGKKVEVTIKATGDTYHIIDTVEVNGKMQPIAVHLPTDLTVTLTDDGKERINVALTFDIDRKDHVKMVGNIRLANIVQSYDFNITRSAIRGTYGMTVNGNPICNLVINNDGFNGLAIDPNNNLRTESDFIKYEKKAESELKPGTTNVLFTILGGEMSIKGKMNGDAYYTAMRNLNDNDHISEQARSEKIAEIWNINIPLTIYYGSEIEQAEIQMVADDGYVAPAIYFIEDRVHVQFDQYFTRHSFGSLIDSTEALINTYIDLFKDNKIEPIDL